jgi:putative membrane protein
MRRILRHYLLDTFSLYLVSQIASGMVFEKSYETLLLAGVGLTVATLLAKPVINLLLLPINLITFGLFKWVSSAMALYLVTIIIPGFRISQFYLAGFSTKFFDMPTLDFQGALSYVAFSFFLSLLTSIFYWVFK